ncbi:hypothetical protein, partial [Oleiphilus sp. HI0066]
GRFELSADSFKLELVPSRLRGEIATFDIKDPDGEVIVEEGRRVNAKQIRKLEKLGGALEVPKEYLYGKVLAKDIINEDTGELVASCNTEITEEVVDALVAAGIES